MTKLTKYTRECIAKAATAFAFDAKQAALQIEQSELAALAHAAVFDAKELAAVAKTPDNWIRRDTCLRFNVAGVTAVLCAQGEGFPVPYRIGDHAAYGCKRLGTIEAGELADRILAYMKAEEETRTARAIAYRQVLQMLNGVTSIKRLEETWPEGAPFYEKYRNKPAAQVPAVRVDEINALLGIAA
jgi:hypothetical protein